MSEASRWERHTHPTGVPYYQSGEWTIEADQRLSSHVGMVFGQMTGEAGREPRTEGWRVLKNGRMMARFTTLGKAKAYAYRVSRATG